MVVGIEPGGGLVHKLRQLSLLWLRNCSNSSGAIKTVICEFFFEMSSASWTVRRENSPRVESIALKVLVGSVDSSGADVVVLDVVVQKRVTV